MEVSWADFIGNGKVKSYDDRHNLPMTLGELEGIIYRAEQDGVVGLYLNNCNITTLPESIGKLNNLKVLSLTNNKLTKLPDAICDLTSLRQLDLSENKLTSLPENIDQLTELKELFLANNQLNSLPKNIGCLRLWELNLRNNQLKTLPDFMCISSGNSDIALNLDNNPLTDLSSLQGWDISGYVTFLGCTFWSKYWTKLSEWKAVWLLDESNAEVRRVLIEQIGYEKICQELNTTTIDIWREYTLLRIDGTELFYEQYYHWEESGIYTVNLPPIVVLKMTCPSTQHIHILRVPPEITSAEAAITWVNHGIHPDQIAFAT
jgi:leucine-rich repeat protein SHOC2